MKKQKTIEAMVLELLETRPQTREDDYILYGSVLKRMGVDLKATTLYDFYQQRRNQNYQHLVRWQELDDKCKSKGQT